MRTDLKLIPTMSVPKPDYAVGVPDPEVCSGKMSKEELAFIAEIAKDVGSWTELGGFIGRSFMCAGLAIKQNGHIQVVDLGLGFYEWHGQTIYTTAKTLLLHRTDISCFLCKMDSARSAEYLRRTDVVFIDAAHSYDMVFRDIKAWKDKCKIIMGHDYHENHPGVIKAVNEMFGKPDKVVGSVWLKRL